jgi:hypothetical protein
LTLLFTLFVLLAPFAATSYGQDTSPSGDPDSPGFDETGPRGGFRAMPGPGFERPRPVVWDRWWKERLYRVLLGLRIYYLKY